MDFNKYTSIKLAQEKINWSEGTECMENYTIWSDRIIRKIKYNPILIDLRIWISNTVFEFDVIGANYLCHAYDEMVYISNFSYNITNILNWEIKYIFSSYLNVEYIVSGSSINDDPIVKYFCVNSNFCRRTIFNHQNIDEMQLRTHNEKNQVMWL